eukprot:9490603-Pyramimonas_sp.AAC.1
MAFRSLLGGPFGGFLDRLGALLGRPGALLGRLGWRWPSGSRLGAVLGPLGSLPQSSWASLEQSWGPPFGGAPGGFLCRLEAILGASWA